MGKSWTFKPDRSLVVRSKKGAARGLALAAEHIAGVSVENTPIEEGTLRRSTAASVDPDNLRAAVSADTPYAVPVHEDMNARHNTGGPKYLERAFNSEVAPVRHIIAQAIKGEL